MGLAVKKMVERGYKETEVGVVPEDWEVVLMETLGSAIIGLTYSPRNVCSDGILVHRSSNIQNNQLSYSDNVYVDCDIPEKLILRTNDILICVRNGSRDLIGKSALISGLSIGETFGAFMSVFRTDGCAHLIYQLFISNIIQRQINESLGATINQITNKTINSFKIPLPPTKAEQTAIANALSDADALINSLEKLIEKKRAIKQGAMQELLTGRKRLPGFEVARGYKETEVGVVPEDWEIKALRDCLFRNPDYGINAAACDYSDDLPTYLRITDISDNGRFLSHKKASVSHPLSDCFYLEEGDLVLARTGASVGKSYLYNAKDGKLVFAGFLIRVKPNPDLLNSVYLKNYLETKSYWNWVQLMSMRSGQPGINSSEYSQILIPLPPTKAEQTAIAETLSNMDSEIEALESKLTKQKLLKQAMMQELLTGKTRLI
jgi:type I restriction enzyme S subunit